MAMVWPQSRGKNVYLDVLAFIGKNENCKAKIILERYSNLDKLLDNTGQTLLHISAKCGNATITQFLIDSGNDVNAQNVNGETPLMLVPARAARTAKILLDANACLRVKDNHGMSALMKLVKNCKAEWSSLQTNREIFYVFYERMKCDYTRQTIAQKLCEAECPLPVVILLNDAELTMHMLERGCALDERAHGLTALHVAVQMADLDNVELLLKYGADVNGADRSGETPLCKYRTDTDDGAEKSAMLKVLLERGASLNAIVTRECGYRELILKRLLIHGQRDTIFAVLENVDLLAKYGSSGQTPLHFLVQNKDRCAEDGIRFAINKNIDVNARDKKGRTALIVAVAKGLTSRVGFLIANGANASLVDIVEKTPMITELTKKSEFRECEYKSLQKHYAKVFQLLLKYKLDFRRAPEQCYFRSSKNSHLIKLALAYVVIAEMDGRPISTSTRSLIKSTHALHDHYECCKRQLEQIQSMTIYGSVTTYKLLTESEEKLVKYACNHVLMRHVQRFMRTKISRDSYYYYILRRRVGTALRTARLRDRCASAVCKITGLPANEHRHIVNKIVSYMSGRDFQMLFQVAMFL